MTGAKARKIRALIEKLIESLSDKDASEYPELHPDLTYSGALIPYKTRIKWTDGNLYVAQYDTYDRQDTDPDHDTNGWVKVMYKAGYRYIPDTMTTATMFAKNEMGWWKEKLYRSKIDNNSWTPEAYPDGWEVV